MKPRGKGKRSSCFIFTTSLDLFFFFNYYLFNLEYFYKGHVGHVFLFDKGVYFLKKWVKVKGICKENRCMKQAGRVRAPSSLIDFVFCAKTNKQNKNNWLWSISKGMFPFVRKGHQSCLSSKLQICPNSPPLLQPSLGCFWIASLPCHHSTSVLQVVAGCPAQAAASGAAAYALLLHAPSCLRFYPALKACHTIYYLCLNHHRTNAIMIAYFRITRNLISRVQLSLQLQLLESFLLLQQGCLRQNEKIRNSQQWKFQEILED